MNGLELSKAFYEEYGRPMLEQQFSAMLPYLACGLFGSGSECLGYDDDISQDHDYEPGFCIFLPEEETVNRRDAFLLERAYAKLPRSYHGFNRLILLPVGGNRHGVLRTADFFQRTVGTPDGSMSLEQWLSVPEQSLLEATNGILFFDNYGAVSGIRKKLIYFPEDVRLKRLAGHLLLMAQSGQYNYRRCLAHGETAAAQYAVVEFVRSAVSAVFLLNKRYQPYYKWCFRAMRELPLLSEYTEPFEVLLTTGNSAEESSRKSALIEAFSTALISALREQNLTSVPTPDLERHAYAVNDGIRDASLRNMNILAAV